MDNNKVATLVPRDHLGLIADDQYYMALSYAAEDQTYRHFFRRRSQCGAYVIVDNSAVELGRPEPFESYLKTAVALGASEIMLPDIFLNPEATIQEANESVLQFMASGLDMDIMVIPQGRTIPDWLDCADRLIEIARSAGRMPTIGISARYVDLFGGSRLPLVLLLMNGRTTWNHLSIHFLGCYTDPRLEVFPMFRYPFFRGVDSSFAAVYAQNGYELTTDVLAAPRPARHIDFINDHYDVALLKTNIETWRTACSKGWA